MGMFNRFRFVNGSRRQRTADVKIMDKNGQEQTVTLPAGANSYADTGVPNPPNQDIEDVSGHLDGLSGHLNSPVPNDFESVDIVCSDGGGQLAAVMIGFRHGGAPPLVTTLT